MSTYQHLYKHLYHIFRNLDTQFTILDCQLENPRITSKKDLTLIKYKKIVERNLEKVQNMLKHEKFRSLDPCRCLNCFEDYGCLKSALYNLLDKIPKTINLSSYCFQVENEKIKAKNDIFYLKRVSVILKSIQLQSSFYLSLVEVEE